VQPCFPTNFMSWDSMKILAAHPLELVIAEIKTCAPRSATLDQFMRDLASLMREERVSLRTGLIKFLMRPTKTAAGNGGDSRLRLGGHTLQQVIFHVACITARPRE